MSLLHASSGAAGADFGEIMHGVWHAVILHGILDTLKIVLFLFAAYLIMEFIEHRASERLEASIKKAGAAGPLVGGAVGLIPQCGFSAMAANFYTGRVISLGTLVAVFLSASDEMLPVMLSGNIPPLSILKLLGYKLLVAVVVGFTVDITMKLMHKRNTEISIDEICENDNCHCEKGILHSAIHHTLTVGGFVLLITLLIKALSFFVGEEAIASVMYDKPVIGHLIAAVLGLIPNCAVSVALTSFCVEGYITAGTMLAGLFSGAGVGLLVLFRVNKRLSENLTLIAILVGAGTLFGLLADLIKFTL